ncbi:CopD family protein [Naumannella cuiyingiana]|uniref:Putative copper export protein n=1 Tax=Naumannella cuiyingiana TaxID=1347891 RepID=A0A7Z0DBZ9_9ACTN|nr:CopD family protein [Naumannella cuiyingiana]NYI72525.1 putative copper export protein [Naumannella cuiyingiana]
MLSDDLILFLTGCVRMLIYLGFVLCAGIALFWAVVWPAGQALRRLVALAAAGIVLLAAGTIASPAVQMVLAGRPYAEVVAPGSGAWLLVRLAALCVAGFYGPELVAQPIRGRRRVITLVLVGVVALSLVAQSNAVQPPWMVIKVIATAGHLLATGAWLGGLVVLAAVLIPSDLTADLDEVIPRFSALATVAIATLAVTGTVHALAIAGGPVELLTSWYGLVLLIKMGVFGAMLLLGNHGRRYARAVVFRLRHLGAGGTTLARTRLHTLGVTLGAEVGLALAVLGSTAILVAVAPS